MTTGSAASLHGLLARPSRPLEPAESISIPPTAVSRPALAAEPPRARVLVFEHEAVIALDLQRILRDAGFGIVGPVASVEEVKALIALSARAWGRIDCAILDLDAAQDEGAAAADLLAEAGVPVVLLTTGRQNAPARLAEHTVVEKPYSASQLLDAMHEAMRTAVATAGDGILYPTAAPHVSFPRIFPQL